MTKPKITGYPQMIEIETGGPYIGQAQRTFVDALVAVVFLNVHEVRFTLEGTRLRCFVSCVPTEDYTAGHMAQTAGLIKQVFAVLRPPPQLPPHEEPKS